MPDLSKSAFLAFCTRIDGAEKFDRQLQQYVDQIIEWDTLPAFAEMHGMGPLLFYHLQRIGKQPPKITKRDLHTAFIRHRDAAEMQKAVLVDVLTAFKFAGIQALVLKGAALRALLYPQSGLRPMADIDLLISPHKIRIAQQLLVDLGFYTNTLQQDEPLPDKHLPMAVKNVAGFNVGIELHHNLYNMFHPASFHFEQIAGETAVFSLDNIEACTLGREEMLWHLCEHLSYHASIWEPIRFIWVADIIGFAEKFVHEINWAFIQQHFPIILKRLSLFHTMTPLSPDLLEAASIKTNASISGVGEEFKGWPRVAFAKQQDKRLVQIFKDTFIPSEWWLRLHYRLDSVESCFWQRWVLHPLFIIGPLYVVEKLKLLWFITIRPHLLKGRKS